MKSKTIKPGIRVRAIVWVWQEDELPTERNFAIGIVSEVFERSKMALYVRLKGLDRIIPIDRVTAI